MSASQPVSALQAEALAAALDLGRTLDRWSLGAWLAAVIAATSTRDPGHWLTLAGLALASVSALAQLACGLRVRLDARLLAAWARQPGAPDLAALADAVGSLRHGLGKPDAAWQPVTDFSELQRRCLRWLRRQGVAFAVQLVATLSLLIPR